MKAKRAPETNLKLNSFLIKINPWIGLFVSLLIVVPNLYEVLVVEFHINSNLMSLAGGLFFFILFLMQIFDQIISLEDMK